MVPHEPPRKYLWHRARYMRHGATGKMREGEARCRTVAAGRREARRLIDRGPLPATTGVYPGGHGSAAAGPTDCPAMDVHDLMPFAVACGVELEAAGPAEVRGTLAWREDRCTAGG